MGDRTSKRERLMPLTTARPAPLPEQVSDEMISAKMDAAVASLKEALKKTPEVSGASIKTTCDISEGHSCNRVRAWILVDRYDNQTIDDIYRIQRDLLQNYQSLEFDLHVVDNPSGALETQLYGDADYLRQ